MCFLKSESQCVIHVSPYFTRAPQYDAMSKRNEVMIHNNSVQYLIVLVYANSNGILEHWSWIIGYYEVWLSIIVRG